MMRQVAGRPILTAERMREAERRAFARGRVTADDLMDVAGLEVARHVRRLDASRRVLVLAGPGNNGGDAYAAARHLRDWGRDVQVAAFGPPKDGPAARMAARWTGPTVGGEKADLSSDHVVVDGLFGTGAVRDGAPHGWSVDMVARAHHVVCIDLPSWIDGDTGALRDWGRGARADATLALGALKPAHMLVPDACGHLLVHDFGPEVEFADTAWTAMGHLRIAPPASDAHKYRALVTVVAGAMAGAARLAARGAAGAGAGYVVLIGDALGHGPLDAVVHRPADRLDDALAGEGVVLLGPGLGRDAAAHAVLDRALASPCRLVLDGDALSLLGTTATERLRARPADRTVLTPHEGEFTRMFDDDGTGKFARTQDAARTSGAAVVHKGRCTIVAQPSGALSASTSGSTWLATAGTGDVLAGAVAARWACTHGGVPGRPLEEAVGLHARASLLAGPAFSADRLADGLPAAMDVPA